MEKKSLRLCVSSLDLSSTLLFVLRCHHGPLILLCDPPEIFRGQGRTTYKQLLGRQRCHDRAMTFFLLSSSLQYT
jgi:hypothetical protein